MCDRVRLYHGSKGGLAGSIAPTSGDVVADGPTEEVLEP